MIALDPSDRGTLTDLMRHPWVNMGQEEPLWPYCELSSDRDPGVTVVVALGLRWDQIQDSGTGRKHDSVSSEESEVGGCTITVRPSPSTDLSSHDVEPSPSPGVSIVIPTWLYQEESEQLQEDQESGQKISEPTIRQQNS